MKTFLISIACVVGLFITATAVMFVFKACPPQGPWPTPPWCAGGVQMPKIGLRGLPSMKTIKQFIPSKVDIYGRVYFKNSQDWIMNGNIFAFGPIVGTNIKWVRELQSHGAKAFSNISTWNSLMAKTPEELPPELKDSILIGFDGKPLYQQNILFMNIIDPAYQNYIKKAIEGDIDGGTDGITIDEHQGTIQALWTGEGPCDQYSLNGFKSYLKNKYTVGELKSKGVDNINSFDYCQYII